MARRPRLQLAALALAGAGLVAACGNGENPVVGPASDATTTTTTTTTASPEPQGFATVAVSATSTNRGLLSKVDATPLEGFDRLTFVFEGDLPGYRVGYIERPVTEDGSGKTVEIDGAAVLEIHFESASGFDLAGEGRQTYTGPVRPDLATNVVKDLVRTGDFEGYLTWAAGIDTKAPFRVSVDPADHKIVVDVRQP